MPELALAFFYVHGRTVCRKCRSNFSAMSMEGRYAENAGAIFWRCPWKDGTVKQGFRNANSLAFRLMNAIRSVNGKMQVPVPRTWYPELFRRCRWKDQSIEITAALSIQQPALRPVAGKSVATQAQQPAPLQAYQNPATAADKADATG